MSIRIFGSGGGVITDATATPEDVISGQVFYNNTGRKTGTLDARRLKSNTYVVPSGTQTSLGRISGFDTYVASKMRGGRGNIDSYTARNTTYILDYYHIIKDQSTSYPAVSYVDGYGTNVYMPIKRFSNLNILISKLDNIQIGGGKYVIGTDTTSTSTNTYQNMAFLFTTGMMAQRISGTAKYPEDVCVSFHYETNSNYPSLVLTDIIISVTTYQYVNSGNSKTITLDKSIPIKISTYVD